MKKLILASASPRRKELLLQIGIDAEIKPSGADEETKSVLPEQIVLDLARIKCLDTAQRLKEQSISVRNLYVLGADTVVALDGRILGKPKDREDAAGMIRMLQGRTHQVFTGVCILRMEEDMPRKGTPEDARMFSVCTDVCVAPMSEQEILDYVSGDEPMDKAGSYGIQGTFAKHITGIRGDYTNVVGLPVASVYKALKELNFFTEENDGNIQESV